MSTHAETEKNDQVGWLEKLLFSFLAPFIFACLVVTVVLVWQISHLQADASFGKVIQKNHPFIINQTNTLNGETITADAELALVGGDGLIIHHHDNPWKRHPHQNRLPISAVKAVNDNLLIVVGMAGIERVFLNKPQKNTTSEAKS